MINVVAAVIKDEDGKILITQRNLQKSQGGLWEFPGGKIEPNETKENAIVREIKEELDIDIQVESYLSEKIFKFEQDADQEKIDIMVELFDNNKHKCDYCEFNK